MLSAFWENVETFGARPALVTKNLSVSYADLAGRADDFCSQVRSQLSDVLQRPLVMLEAVNCPESVAAYLGCLRAGWPVILAAEGQADPENRIFQKYRPNVVYRCRGGAGAIELADPEPADLHPDLAVLLSTSGTTGASKLVRLSRENIASNAASIAQYLEVCPDDCAITLLPFHYSYGMSVLHVQLLAGGSLVLTDGSVVDQEVRSLAAASGVTSLAMVPAQFELLDDLAWLPSLRYVTQAGGRIDSHLADRFATFARNSGWRFYIMYGQTEAGPRMSYLPPEDAQDWSHTIGRPIPGGTLWLEDEAGAEISGTGRTGELVYRGPNVMLGYAAERGELGAVAGPGSLKTGDMAERLENGYFRITGRASRFIKLLGLRISLDEVERELRESGVSAYVSGSDKCLAVFVLDGSSIAPLRSKIAQQYGVPESSVAVTALDKAPLLPSGKIDYRSLQRQAEVMQPIGQDDVSTEQLLRKVLRTSTLDLDRNFLDYGGDSLSYLEVQMHLANRLGTPPPQWESKPLRELTGASAAGSKRARHQDLSADVLGRVIAILAVVTLHSTTLPTGGGTFLLFILIGYSLARFHSATLFGGNVVATLRSMLLPILVCYYILIALVVAVHGPIESKWVLLFSNIDHSSGIRGLTPYWFVSTYTQLIVLFTVPFLVPPVRTWCRREPFAAGLLCVALLAGITQIAGLDAWDAHARHRYPLAAGGLLGIGWCAWFAKDTMQKGLVTVALVGLWAVNWSDLTLLPAAFLLVGGGGLIWSLSIPVPSAVAQAVMRIGSLSLFIYLVHPVAISVVSNMVSSAEGVRLAAVVALSLVGAAAAKACYDHSGEMISALRRNKRHF